MAWDPTVPATNAALLSAPIRDNFAALDALAVNGVINPMSGVGDLIRGGSGGVPTRLAVGTNGHVLTLAAGLPGWAAIPATAPAYPLLAPDGTVGAPSYSFATATNTGMSYIGGLQVIAAGVRMMSFSGTSTYIDEGTLTIRDLTGGSATGASLSIDGTDLLAQRRTGANPQTFRLYNTYTDASNGEWLETTWSAANPHFYLRTHANGSGTVREFRIGHGGTTAIALRVLPTIDGGIGLGVFNASTTAITAGRVVVGGSSSVTATSGTSISMSLAETFSPTATSTMGAVSLRIAPSINYSNATPGAGTYEAIRIAVTETALPTGQSYMIRASGGAAGTTDVFAVTNDGRVVLRAIAAPSGTPAATGWLYVDTADKKAKFKDDAGLVSALF